MRLPLFGFITILLMIPLSSDLYAQDDQFETVSFVFVELRFNEGDFETMKRTTETNGITPSDLGSWMERSGNIMPKVEGAAMIDAFPAEIHLYKFDARGSIVSREGTQIQLTERPSNLGQLTRGALPRLTDGLMAFDAFMAVDMFLPQVNETDSFIQVERQMSSAVQRVMGASQTEYAIAVLVVPEGRQYGYKMSPGLVIFTGNAK